MKVSQVNHKPELLSNLRITYGENEIEMKNRGRFVDLFQPGRRRLTAFIWILWFVSALGYYGVVLMSTELLNTSKDYCGHSESSLDKNSSVQSMFLNDSAVSTSCSLQCE